MSKISGLREFLIWLMVSEVSTCDTVGPRLAGQACQPWWLGNKQRAKTVPGHTLCDPFPPARPHLPIRPLLYDPIKGLIHRLSRAPRIYSLPPNALSPGDNSESSCNKGDTHATQTCRNSSTVEKPCRVSFSFLPVILPPCLPCLPLSLTLLIPPPHLPRPPFCSFHVHVFVYSGGIKQHSQELLNLRH